MAHSVWLFFWGHTESFGWMCPGLRGFLRVPETSSLLLQKVPLLPRIELLVLDYFHFHHILLHFIYMTAMDDFQMAVFTLDDTFLHTQFFIPTCLLAQQLTPHPKCTNATNALQTYVRIIHFNTGRPVPWLHASMQQSCWCSTAVLLDIRRHHSSFHIRHVCEML